MKNLTTKIYLKEQSKTYKIHINNTYKKLLGKQGSCVVVLGRDLIML